MPEIVAQRVFDPLYIILDSVFLAALYALLFFKRRYLTLLFGLFGGLLYFAVDYGIFHLWLGTRSIEGGSLFWVLLWMSLSYGTTNFVLIWVWLSKDKSTREWTLLILLWWFVCPAFDKRLRKRRGHTYSENDRRLSRLDGNHTFHFLRGNDCFQSVPKGQEQAFSAAVAVFHRSFRSARLGAFTADRRHTQRGNRSLCRQAGGHCSKLAAGNEFGHAVDLSDIFVRYVSVFRRPHAETSESHSLGENERKHCGQLQKTQRSINLQNFSKTTREPSGSRFY